MGKGHYHKPFENDDCDLSFENPFGELPSNPGHVYYRLPSLFLKDSEERKRDMLQAAGPVVEFSLARLDKMEPGPDGDKLSRGSPESMNGITFHLNCGIAVRMDVCDSELWVKTYLGAAHASDDEARAAADELDAFFKSQMRTVYKYVYRDGRLYAFPLRGGDWAPEVFGYLGLDAGSISINSVIVDEHGNVLEKKYTLTEGDLLNNIKKSLRQLSARLPDNLQIRGAGCTGSGHELAMALLGADVYETELDAHAEAASHLVSGAQVVFDIGGQDSKVMYLEDGLLDDAGMNKKCGAGTGAFLDAQAARLGIPIERFGEVAARAKKPYSFSSMCTVFVGRDLIAEQAKGNPKENIIAGLHKSLAKNFFSTLGIDKKRLRGPIVFQGGVASNGGVKRALEECLEDARGEPCEIIVPLHHDVMGAIGMALVAKRGINGKTGFRGFKDIDNIVALFAECDRQRAINCEYQRKCDLVKLYLNSELIGVLYACKQYHQLATRQMEDGVAL